MAEMIDETSTPRIRATGEHVMIRDIAEALLRLNRVMQQHGLSPVRAIELGSHQDGDRLRATPVDTHYLHVNGGMVGYFDTRQAAKIVGVKLLYPGRDPM